MADYRIQIKIDPAAAKSGSAEVKSELKGIEEQANRTKAAVTGAVGGSEVERGVTALTGNLKNLTTGFKDAGYQITVGYAKAARDAETETARLASTTSRTSGVVGDFVTSLVRLGRTGSPEAAQSVATLATGLTATEAAMLGVVGVTALLAAGVGVVALAFAQGGVEANRFNNILSLSGNYAGLTTQAYHDMARGIADATDTSVASNERLISSLAATNDFTAEEIEKIVRASQQLSEATGQSAEDVIKSFEKMADGPVQYALEFQRQYAGSITPAQLDHIRLLDETGRRSEALEELITITTDHIAENTIKNTGLIVRGWNAVTNAISDAWLALKQYGAEKTFQGQLDDVTDKLDSVRVLLRRSESTPQFLPGVEAQTEGYRRQYIELIRVRDALQKKIDKERDAVEAQAKKTKADLEGDAALEKIHGTYGRLVDSTVRYNNAVADLDETIAKARARNPNDPFLQNLEKNRAAALEQLRKQYLPDAERADRKAEAEARRASAERQRELRAEAQEAQRRADAVEQYIRRLEDEQGQLRQIEGLERSIAKAVDDATRAKAGAGRTGNKDAALTPEERARIESLVRQNAEIRLANSLRDEYTQSLEFERQLEGVAGVALEAKIAILRETDRQIRAGNLPANGELSESQKELIISTVEAEHALDDEARALREIAGPVDAYIDRVRSLERLLKLGTISQTEFNAALLNSEIQRAQRDQDANSGDPALRRNAALDQVEADRQAALLVAEQTYRAELKLAEGSHAAIEASERRHEQRMAEINRQAALRKRAAQQAERLLTLGNAQSIAEGLAGIAEAGLGKQSAAYKALFAVSKAFAVAQSIIKIQQGIAEAASLPFPANLAAISTVIAETASIVSTIQAVKLSFASGGIVPGNGGPRADDQLARVSSGEFIVNAESTRRNRALLEAINSGRTPVAQNDNSSSTATTVVSVGDINVTIQGGRGGEEDGRAAGEAARREIRALVNDELTKQARAGGALTRTRGSVLG